MSGIHKNEGILVIWNLYRHCKYCDDSLRSLPSSSWCSKRMLWNCYVVCRKYHKGLGL